VGAFQVVHPALNQAEISMITQTLRVPWLGCLADDWTFVVDRQRFLLHQPSLSTGTPIEQDDVNTPAVFGQYIDVYGISRAVEDGATVPIYYESRLARIELPDAEKPKVDAEIEELTEDEAVSEQERLKRK
jgi:hypothetical protein